MADSSIYILIAIVILLVIGVFMFVFRNDKKRQKLSTLASLAIVFILGGIVFGDNKYVGYTFFGVGIILAIIDIVLKHKRKKESKKGKNDYTYFKWKFL